MSTCRACSQPLAPGARFCGGCGAAQVSGPAPTPSASLCRGCGAPIAPSARFCGACGAVNAGSVAAPSPASPAPTAAPSPAPAPSRPPPAAPAPAPAAPEPRFGPFVLYVVPPSALHLAAVVKEACADHAHRVVVTNDVFEVQAALAALDEDGVMIDGMCLVGGHEELPHVSFVDDTDNDEAVYTDNDWGRFFELADDDRDTDGLPHVPVTRIPTTDPALVRRLLSVRDALPASWNGGLAVTARTWQRASAAVLERIVPSGGVKLHASPSLDDDGIRGLMGRSVGRLFFNVHGSDQVTHWVGDDGAGAYPAVLRPRSVGVAANAILVSEACYGARHDEADTIALRFLAAGGSAFVGSTIIAWGPPAPPNSLADLIPAGVYAALDRGLSLGGAALEARTTILEEARESGRVTPQVVNTISSFVAYGSPLARVAGAPKSPRATGGARASGGRATTRGVTPRSAGGNPNDVLGRVREGRLGGPLAAARERLAAQERRLGWRRLGVDELPPGGLASRFRTAAQIQAELSELLGGSGVNGKSRVARYATDHGEEQMVYASADAGGVRRTAAIAVDASGRVVGRYVTRGGRAGRSGG